MLRSVCLLFCVVVGTTSGFLLVPEFFRNVTGVLTVRNGQGWGAWEHAEFCPEDTYAIGYALKNQEVNDQDDDTALNGVRLICANTEFETRGGPKVNVTSGVGPWGEWTQAASCSHAGSYLTVFSMQVESNQVFGDDTAVNFVKFKCRGRNVGYGGDELAVPPGHGHWGKYGSWSQECPPGSAVCGLATSIEPDQGSGDDTALDDLKLFCCSEQ